MNLLAPASEREKKANHEVAQGSPSRMKVESGSHAFNGLQLVMKKECFSQPEMKKDVKGKDGPFDF